jgi:hypothetical protein
MKRSKPGKRYPLLIYKRYMDRLWGATLVLGLLLGLAWLWLWFDDTPLIERVDENWLFVGAVFSLGFAAFTFLSRSVAYVQPHRDHIRLVTPFLRLHISYRRIVSVHPASFQQLFPPQRASWGARRFLEPFYPKTAVVVDVSAYPMSPFVLRLFLAPQMLSPKSRGFVLVVPDWMELSTDLDSHIGVWSQDLGQKRAAARARR